MFEPKKYDMKNKEDLERWFREMEGYLKIGFLKSGTDFKGREYALDGFNQLKEIILKTTDNQNYTNKGCGKEIPAGFDRDKGYSLYNTCGLTLMGETYLCPVCSHKGDSAK